MKTRHRILDAVLVGCLCVVTAGWTCARGELVVLAEANFNVDPADEPTLSWITLVSGGFNTNGLWEGIGHYDTLSLSNDASVGHSAPPGSFRAGNDLVSVSARMRVLDEDGYNGGSTSVDVIRNGWHWRMGIVSQKQPYHNAQFVHLNADNDVPLATVQMDTSVFRTYALVVTDATAGRADLYVDDVLTIPDAQAQTLGTGAFDGRIEFGDTGSTGAARSEFEFVRVEGLAPILSAGPAVGDATALEFLSESGLVYRLEAATLPDTNQFSSTGAHIVGDGGTQQMFDPSGFSTGRAYRARVVQ